jgi:hypothetical protein
MKPRDFTDKKTTKLHRRARRERKEILGDLGVLGGKIIIL